MTKFNQKTAIALAVAKEKNQAQVARFLGVNTQRVNHWLKIGKIPKTAFQEAVLLEDKTGICKTLLCPDFPWGSVEVNTSGNAA